MVERKISVWTIRYLQHAHAGIVYCQNFLKLVCAL